MRGVCRIHRYGYLVRQTFPALVIGNNQRKDIAALLQSANNKLCKGSIGEYSRIGPANLCPLVGCDSAIRIRAASLQLHLRKGQGNGLISTCIGCGQHIDRSIDGDGNLVGSAGGAQVIGNRKGKDIASLHKAADGWLRHGVGRKDRL